MACYSSSSSVSDGLSNVSDTQNMTVSLGIRATTTIGAPVTQVISDLGQGVAVTGTGGYSGRAIGFSLPTLTGFRSQGTSLPFVSGIPTATRFGSFPNAYPSKFGVSGLPTLSGLIPCLDFHSLVL